MSKIKAKPKNAKPEWASAIYEAASAGRRFDHDEDCPVIYFGSGKTKNCKCYAGPANDALNEIADALKVGIVVEQPSTALERAALVCIHAGNAGVAVPIGLLRAAMKPRRNSAVTP